MDSEDLGDEPDDLADATAPPAHVQCPNCCRLAPVVRRSKGLLFYECELCLTVGAMPEPATPPAE